METLNMIADDIAFKLGNPYDSIFKESIKRTVKHWRATLIRQSIQKEGRIFDDYLTAVNFKLEKVDLVKELGVEICCGLIAPELEEDSEYIAYKVIGDVPKVIRNDINTKGGFNFVGNVIRTERFIYSELYNYRRLSLLSGKNTFFTKINNDYYVLPSKCKSYCDIVFEGVLESPEEYCDTCGDTFVDDREFKIPQDMITYIKDNIVKGAYPLLNVDTKEVEVKPTSAPMQQHSVAPITNQPDQDDNS